MTFKNRKMKKIVLTYERIKFICVYSGLAVVLSKLTGIWDLFPKTHPYLVLLALLFGIFVFTARLTTIFNRWVTFKD